MKPLNIFIGFDHVETVAYHVLSHSIMHRSSVPVSITPICLSHLHGIFDRDRDPNQSNDFAFSRWLVPFLSGYEGVSLFMDLDMLVLRDIAELFSHFDPDKTVQVVKHNHKPVETTKYLGQKQIRYPRKNWSSVMLFNNEKCTALTHDRVENDPGLDLHQFRWVEDDQIGELPHRWNHLVGYDPIHSAYDRNMVCNAHFTTGGPYFDEYSDVEFAHEWREEYKRMNYCKQR